jgi:hypothetical protein
MPRVVPLFTSIPMHFSRISADGGDIGATYLEACISSWMEAGFKPFTINGPCESVDKINQITVGRDASDKTGRPQVYLDDVLSAIAAHVSGPFALVNSDIMIPHGSAAAERVGRVEAGTFLFSQRIDSTDLNHDTGEPYRGGFDFFAGHTADLRALPNTQFVFGAPWWDHFLPLVMHMRRRRIAQLRPIVRHLKHEDRWDQAIWTILGKHFTALMASSARGSYRWQLRALERGGRGGKRSTVRAQFKVHTPSLSGRQLDSTLHRVSDLNLRFLQQFAETSSC